MTTPDENLNLNPAMIAIEPLDDDPANGWFATVHFTGDMDRVAATYRSTVPLDIGKTTISNLLFDAAVLIDLTPVVGISDDLDR